MGGAAVTATADAEEFLVVVRAPVPVFPAASVCDAVTVTGPAGSPPTSTPEADQAPLLHKGEGTTATLPMLTDTDDPFSEQVPETP
ncbi:hypothetical protein D3C71_2076470 [compost metagenome]